MSEDRVKLTSYEKLKAAYFEKWDKEDMICRIVSDVLCGEAEIEEIGLERGIENQFIETMREIRTALLKKSENELEGIIMKNGRFDKEYLEQMAAVSRGMGSLKS